MERAHGRKNVGADPRRVLPLGGRHDLNLLVDGASAMSILLLCSPTPVNTVVLPESAMLPYRSFGCRVTHHDGIEGGVSDAAGLFPDEAGLEKQSGRRESSLPTVMKIPGRS
jgi:hypothetical protein